MAIPTQLGKHFWPTFAYVAGQRVDYLSPTIYITDILIFLIFFCVISKTFFKRHPEFISGSFLLRFRNPFGIPRASEFGMTSKSALVFLAILLYLSLGIFFSKSPLNGWYELLKLLELGFFAWLVSKERAIFSLLFWAFGIGVIVEGTLALLQFFHQGSLQGIWYFLGERFYSASTPGIANATIHGQLLLRPYATFPHPNVFAGYLVIAMLFLLPYVFSLRERSESKGRKVLAILAVIFGSVVLLLTFSRTAIVVFFALAVMYVYLKFVTLRIWTLLGICILVLGIFFDPLLNGRFTDIHGYMEAVTIRDLLAQSSWWMFVNHPLFGVGLGNFLPSLPYYLPRNVLFGLLQPVHNIFLFVLAETGIAGLGVFLLVLYKAFTNSWKNKTTPLFQFSLLSLLAICLIGMTDHYFLTLQQGQLLFVLILGISFRKNKFQVTNTK